MAVKAPSPPTPPTPPTVPGVTLSEGGSVTQSNAPPANGTTSKSTDNEKQMEEQAREAVASGSGGLSRTTQKNLAAEAKAAKAAAKEAQQSGQNQAQATIDTGRSQAAQAANLGSAGAVPQDTSSGKAVPGQEAATLQADQPPKFDYHGLTYWLPMLLVAFAAAALLVKKFLHRQGRKGELTKADIEADALGAVESRELRGLTPDEVLARLEAQEAPAKVEAARTQVAKAKIKQSYSQKPKPKAKAAPKKPPKTKAGPRKMTQEEERQRFEVRI